MSKWLRVTDVELAYYLHALADLQHRIADLPVPQPYWWHWLRWGCERHQIRTALVVLSLN